MNRLKQAMSRRIADVCRRFPAGGTELPPFRPANGQPELGTHCQVRRLTGTPIRHRSGMKLEYAFSRSGKNTPATVKN